jgi:hypothetical protein
MQISIDTAMFVSALEVDLVQREHWPTPGALVPDDGREDGQRQQRDRDRDERVAISLDPEEALRGPQHGAHTRCFTDRSV